MTFDTFCVGDDYADAFNAAVRVADPAAPPGLLLLSGPSGVGKSHLMQAVAARCRERGMTVRHQPIGECLAEYLSSLSSDREKAAFRHRFLEADVLLLDNVDELVGKTNTQALITALLADRLAVGKRSMLCVTEHGAPLPFVQALLSETNGTHVALPRPSRATLSAVLAELCKTRAVSLSDTETASLLTRCEDVPTLTGALNRLLLQQELGD